MYACIYICKHIHLNFKTKMTCSAQGPRGFLTKFQELR